MKEIIDSFLWDAETYDKVSDPHEQWARKIIFSKKWAQKEIVMDAGCGSGRITKILAEIVPFGKVYGIDSDENMIKKAKENLKDFKNVKILQSDLLDINFDKIQSKVNVIFSNAVLHWILDHNKIFSNFYDLLFDEGQILIQCGGYGNLQKSTSIFDAVKHSSEFKQYFSNWKNQWNFAKPSDTKNILKDIGYTDIRVYLEDYPVTFKDRTSYSIYLKTVVLGPYLKFLNSEKLQNNFLQRIIQLKENENEEQMLTLDYKRLNIFATK